MRLREEERAKRLEFLRRRQGGIGGSDLPRILGLSNWGTALDVYYDKTREITEEDVEDDSIHQMRGHTFEPMAIAHYWRETGRTGRAHSGVHRHPDYPHVIVSPDFEIFADTDREPEFRGTGVGEIKSPVSAVFRRVIENGLRLSELVQLQANIAVARREWGSLCYFNMEHERGPVIHVDQAADPVLGEFLLKTGERFWKECVEARIPPKNDEWKLLDDPAAPKVVDLSGELAVLEDDELFTARVRRLLDAKILKKDAEDAYRAQLADVLEHLLDVGHAKSQIPGVARLSIVTKKGRVSFDKKTLAHAAPLDRDKVAKWIAGYGVEFPGVSNIHDMMSECGLDLSLFESTGSSSQYLLPNAMKADG